MKIGTVIYESLIKVSCAGTAQTRPVEPELKNVVLALGIAMTRRIIRLRQGFEYAVQFRERTVLSPSRCECTIRP